MLFRKAETAPAVFFPLLLRIFLIRVGTWLSLVEHSVRDAGVGGSNPLVPTILFDFCYLAAKFSFLQNNFQVLTDFHLFV